MKNSFYSTDDLIAAPATVRGKSALAVIRTAGPKCLEAVARVFSRPKNLTESEANRIILGWIQDANGEKIDQVLLSVFRMPASFTGDDSVEISCHGGPTVVDRIMECLRSVGFRDAGPGEFTFRAFSSGKVDLTRAEATKDIIDARTDKARALAAARLAGSVESAVDVAKALVKQQAAVAALALDYPEDEVQDVPFDFPAITVARESLERLVATWATGTLLRNGLRVALVGPTNAGKSSLFNLFLKEERSIVTEQPGTTRDWVEAWLNLDGIPLRLVDTAGLRIATHDPIEREGIRRTRELINGSDLVLCVADGTAGVNAARQLEQDILENNTTNTDLANRLIRVWNKADKIPSSLNEWMGVSALTGEGFEELKCMIRDWALKGEPSFDGDSPVINSVRQKNLLQTAIVALRQFEMHSELPADLKAEDLREALDALGELTGEVSREDVLETMFSTFCVGK